MKYTGFLFLFIFIFISCMLYNRALNNNGNNSLEYGVQMLDDSERVDSNLDNLSGSNDIFFPKNTKKEDINSLTDVDVSVGQAQEKADYFFFIVSLCRQSFVFDSNSQALLNNYFELCSHYDDVSGESLEYDSEESIVARYKHSRRGTEEYTEIAFDYAALNVNNIESLIVDLDILTLNAMQLSFLCQIAASKNNYPSRCLSGSYFLYNDSHDFLVKYVGCDDKECRQEILNKL